MKPLRTRLREAALRMRVSQMVVELASRSQISAPSTPRCGSNGCLLSRSRFFDALPRLLHGRIFGLAQPYLS
jgi:hypothetical protein